MPSSPETAGDPSPLTPAWTTGEALRCFLLCQAAIPLISEATLAIFLPLASPGVNAAAAHLTPVIAWALCLSALARLKGLSLRTLAAQLGLSWPETRFRARARLTLLGVGGALAIIALISVATLWISGAPIENPYEGAPAPTLEALTLAGLTLAPFLEEVVFRGFLQPAFARRLPMAAAIGLSATLFALCHTLYEDAPVAMASVFALGLWFGWLRARTGSLWPSIAAHLANNAVAAWSLAS